MVDEQRAAAAQVIGLMQPLMRTVFTEMRRLSHPSHYVLLAMLQRRRRTLSEMADYQGVSLPGMSSAVNTLEEHGWVRRVRDQQDRRVVYVELTEAGQRMLAQMEQTTRERIADLLAALSEDELRTVMDGLQLLNRALETTLPISSERT